MRRPSLPHLARPGLRAGVLFVCSILVVAAAMGVSNTVSDHLATVAVDEAVASTQAVVSAFVAPRLRVPPGARRRFRRPDDRRPRAAEPVEGPGVGDRRRARAPRLVRQDPADQGL